MRARHGRSHGPYQRGVWTLKIEQLLNLARRAPSSSHRLPLNGVTVLLADADASTSAAMQAIFQEAGARVLVANSPAAALALAQEADAPEAHLMLVCGLELSHVAYDLIALLAKSRRDRGRPAMRACALREEVDSADPQRALHAGFDVILPALG